MFHVPDTYRVDVKVALKDFIPKDVKPKDKKKIKDAIIYSEIYGSDHCPVGLEIEI